MGIHSVKAVYLLAANRNLGDHATRLLAFMASQTLDYEGDNGEPANTFWAGRDAMALGLGKLVMEYDRTDDGGRAKKAAYESVRSAVAELIEAGLIQRTETGSGRRRSTYRLLVPAPPSRSARRSAPLETAWT